MFFIFINQKIGKLEKSKKNKFFGYKISFSPDGKSLRKKQNKFTTV